MYIPLLLFGVFAGVLGGRGHSLASAETQDFTRYLTLDEWYAWLNTKATACGFSRCQLKFIGTSHDNDPIYVMEITNGDPMGNKPAIFVDGGAHGREYIGVSAAMYLIQKLIDDYPGVIGVSDILDNFVVYVLPILSPDSYRHTEEDRMWRNTRTDNDGDACFGADPFRNFDIEWNMTDGADDIACHYFYRGPHAFSEPSASVMASYMSHVNDINPIEYYISLGSYGQQILYPYAYTQMQPSNIAGLFNKAQAATQIMYNANGKIYTHSSHYMYKGRNCSGTPLDWTTDVLGVPYAYQMLLRDLGQYGFELPESDILETCLEAWDGFSTLVRW